LIIEIGSVFLIFLPRRLRAVAAYCVLLLQSLIVLTRQLQLLQSAHYAFMHFLFDDAALRRVVPVWLGSRAQGVRRSRVARL